MTFAPSPPSGLPVLRAGFAVSLLSARTGLRLSGQADLVTVDLLQQAIAALPPSADEIHLLLAGLEFIDVAAARELVMLTGRPPRPRLVLHYPSSGLLKLLQLCWPEARSRFIIGTARPDSTRAGGYRTLRLAPAAPADGPAPGGSGRGGAGERK